MKKTEVMKMLAFAEYLYPSFRSNDKSGMINAWAEMFADINEADAMAAMKTVCAKSKYFPSAGEVVAEINSNQIDMKGYVKC